MADVMYREAVAEDWPAIARIVGRGPDDGPALRRYLQNELDPGLAWVAVETTDETTDDLAGDQRGIVGAAVAGVPRVRGVTDAGAGAPDAPREGREGRAVFVGVAPQARRRGIGRALLDRILGELRQRDVGRVVAEVEGTEVEALALFRRAGFETTGQTLSLTRPAPAGPSTPGGPVPAGGPPSPGPAAADIRRLTIDDVPHLAGLLIQLGIERAHQPHDDLPSLTPAQLEGWLQRPATVAFAAWEPGDPQTPLGLAWATRRPDDAVLRYIGVEDDARRHGIGRALLRSVASGVGPRPLRVRLVDPGEQQEFFRRLGFAAEQVVYRLSTALQPERGSNGAPRAVDLE
jgi:ribosomal protein S18 acetylase RimI-like enzyme